MGPAATLVVVSLVVVAGAATSLTELFLVDSLFNASAPPEQVAPLARRFLAGVRRNPHLAPSDVDLGAATALYDRLLQSPLPPDDLHALILQLLPYVPKLAWPVAGTTPTAAVSDLLERIPVELFPSMISQLSPVIGAAVRALQPEFKGGLRAAGCSPAQVTAVRRRFGAPFHALFPYNQQVAVRLLASDDVCAELRARPASVAVLLRYGLRFPAAPFLRRVRPGRTALPHLYPLLMVSREPGLRPYDVMKAALDLDALRDLFALDTFGAQLAQDAAWTVAYLARDLGANDARLVEAVAQQGPLLDKLARVQSPDRGLTLLHAAVKYKRFALIGALIGAGADLRDHDGRRPLDYVATWSRVRLLEFGIFRLERERQRRPLPLALLGAVEQRQRQLDLR